MPSRPAFNITASARYGLAAGSGLRTSIRVLRPRDAGIRIIGERLLGPLGAVLAVPIGAVVQVLVQDLVIARFNQSDTGMTGARVRAALEGAPSPATAPSPNPADDAKE